MAKRNLIELAVAVGKEYRGLPKGERQIFCQKLGWSQGRIQAFAKVGEKFPAKQKVITSRRRDVCMDDLGVEHMLEISQTPDKTLEAAADAGMFDKPVSKRDIIRLRKTGQILKAKSEPIPKTDIEELRALMVRAENRMRKTSLAIASITALMEDAGIRDARGKEATALIKAFEKLCTKMATANPKTSARAFAILRGEV